MKIQTEGADGEKFKDSPIVDSAGICKRRFVDYGKQFPDLASQGTKLDNSHPRSEQWLGVAPLLRATIYAHMILIGFLNFAATL